MKNKVYHLKRVTDKLKEDFDIKIYQECIEIALELISEKLDSLDYEFDNIESMLRAAVIAQIIYDNEQWERYASYFPDKKEQYSFLNSIQILEKNLND